jgi:hypothetical protein
MDKKIIVVGVIGSETIPTRLYQEAREIHGTDVELITVEQAQQRMLSSNDCTTLLSVTITKLPELVYPEVFDEYEYKIKKQERQEWKYRQRYHNKK